LSFLSGGFLFVSIAAYLWKLRRWDSDFQAPLTVIDRTGAIELRPNYVATVRVSRAEQTGDRRVLGELDVASRRRGNDRQEFLEVICVYIDYRFSAALGRKHSKPKRLWS
jgi:hypothetical protein